MNKTLGALFLAAALAVPAAHSTALAPPAAVPAATSASPPPAAPSSAAPPAYKERRGVVFADIDTIVARIPTDSDEYAVAAKRIEIEKRNLSYAMHEKYMADNTVSPAAAAVAKRVEWETDRRIKWRRAEMSVKEAQEAASDIADRRESELKSQYAAILNLGDAKESVEREIASQDMSQAALEARIGAGAATPSEIDVYKARAARLLADRRAIEREISLAERKLKRELIIAESKDIELTPFEDVFSRYADARVERDIDAAVNADFDVVRAEWEIGVLKEEREIMLMCDRDGELMYDLQVNETSILEAEYELVGARAQVEESLWTSYYAILNQEDVVLSAKLAVSAAENGLASVEARSTAGLSTFIEESDARLLADEARAKLETETGKYVRMVENFSSLLS